MKVKNPRNILKYQSKAITDLRGKKIVFLLLGVTVFGGIGALLCFALSWTVSFVISGVLALPFLLSAFLEFNGLSFSEILSRIWKIEFQGQGRRYYKSRGYKN